MRRRTARFWWISGALIAVIVVAVAMTSVALASRPDSTDVTAAVKALPLFRDAKFTAHLVVPKDADVENMLAEKGVPMKGALRAQALQAFRQEWAKRNPTTPNPGKLEKLVKNERLGSPQVVTTSTFMSLAVPVEFPATETFTGWDGTSVTATGPLHNQIPAPGTRDNNTIWYNDTTPSLYNELYFGVGPKAGVVVNHPNLGKVDLRGNTMANYYLEQSEGKFQPHGAIYSKWLQAAHPEAWYGNNNPDNGDNSPRAADLVKEVVDAINADNASFPWQTYDGDGDGIVDNFTVIHAGMGEEAGGGLQGSDSIWSHASALSYPTGYRACVAGTHGATRDIYVREYSMDPENLDIGVISEEYGHAAFGLPDIYTTDGQASPSNWAIMEAGSWNGILGGMQPAPFPLYFRYLVGWAKPVELKYNSKAATLTVGQLSLRPKGTQSGIKINLPDTTVATDNNAGTGQGWWSRRGDLADFYLAHDFDLTGATAPLFSFSSYWSIEEGFDYGYVEASDDGGTTWTKLQDTSGFMVKDANGDYGLTGEDSGTVTFDLTAYAGKTISLRLRYISDLGLQWGGWWADDFSLVDGGNVLFTDDVESGPDGWTTNNFVLVPRTDNYPLYYLAEWRNNSGFDRGLKYPYVTVYSNETTNEWEVDRAPYSVPGMLLWIRNAAYDFDYTLWDQGLFDPPSYGPKHALLVVDSHYWPLEWNGMGTTGAHLRLSSRAQPGNATFALQPTTSFTIRRADTSVGNVLETKTFASLPPISQFHDSLGYYPGLRYWEDDPINLYFWDWQASATIPAKGPYSTKITDGDKNPIPDFFGTDMGDTILGTGDPRDDGVQYGINLAVLDKAKDGSWGTIAFWNAKSLGDLTMTATQRKSFVGTTITYTLVVKNISPAAQSFTLSDAIPAGTKYLTGAFYKPSTKSIEWKGTVASKQSRTFTFTVRVNSGTPVGAKITNTATLGDDANGDTATLTVKVMK